jgi:hypothetical protein
MCLLIIIFIINNNNNNSLLIIIGQSKTQAIYVIQIKTIKSSKQIEWS